VPIYCVLVVLAISLLSFLQVSNGSATVLTWFVNLVTASQLINFAVMCGTFLFWLKACKAQGLDRNLLPYKSFLQPYAAWYGMIGCTVMAFVGGYTVRPQLPSRTAKTVHYIDRHHQVFLPGNWDVPTFIFSYFMIGLFPVLYFGWKFIKKTKIKKAHEIDIRGEVEEIDEYTRNYVPAPYK
jgi:yeast amino acid transporter